MIKNYILSSFRNMMRYPSFSAINILGLAVGMSICLAVIMLVADQLSYDRYNTNRDQVYRIYSRAVHGDSRQAEIGDEAATTPMPLKDALSEYAGIEKIVQLRRGFGNAWVELDQLRDVNIPLAGFFADPEALDFFQYELKDGNSKTALSEPYSVVLSNKAANKLFSNKNAIGELINMGKLGTYKVTGVLKEQEIKTHISFEALASMSTVQSLEALDILPNESKDWSITGKVWTYVSVAENISEADVQTHLDRVFQEKIIANASLLEKSEFRLQALTDITPGKFLTNPNGPFMPWELIYFFSGLAAVIMLTSCFNFTNLSIARSITRAKEIGIRKVSGASRIQLFSQFLTEGILISLLSLIIAIFLMMVLKPYVLEMHITQLLKWDLSSNLSVYSFFVVFAASVGLIAGIFPAIVLSGFQPVKVLKDLGNLKLFSGIGLRKGLLVTQFTLSLIFIISVIVIYEQMTLFTNTSHGFESTNNIMVKLNEVKPSLIQAELRKYPNVLNFSATSHIPASGYGFAEGFKRSTEDTEWNNIEYFSVDGHYLENMGLTLKAGEFFSEDTPEKNQKSVIINEKALSIFHIDNMEDAIGTQILSEKDSSKLNIVGVVKDYNHQALLSDIEPLMLLYRPEEYNLLQIKFEGSFENASEVIETAWVNSGSDKKIEFKLMEDEIRSYYELLFGDIRAFIATISVLAVLISCLGMLGMVTYTTEAKLKELSIRKVLGASEVGLVFLLSKGFISILAVAIVVAVPTSYYLNLFWLETIAYHISIDFGMIGFGIGILLVFGALTIGSQTLRAAFTNTIDNLRND